MNTTPTPTTAPTPTTQTRKKNPMTNQATAPTPTPARVTRKPRRTLAGLINQRTTLAERVDAFHRGWNGDRLAIATAKAAMIPHRVRHGFAPVDAPMTGAPDTNRKLTKGDLPSYGLTIAAHMSKLMDGRYANACEWANQCAAVCVLKRGHGGRTSVQRARAYKTDFLAFDTLHAMTLIGAELRAGVRKHGHIAFRSDVNADLSAALLFGDALQNIAEITAYNYSKNPDALTDSDRLGADHIAYSFSESSDVAAVNASTANVAVVTDRQYGDPIAQWHPTKTVVDADLSDLWMLADNVIGDLSFKRDGLAIADGLTFVQRVGYTSAPLSPIAAREIG